MKILYFQGKITIIYYIKKSKGVFIMEQFSILSLISEIKNNINLLECDITQKKIVAKLCVGGDVFLITGVKDKNIPTILCGYFDCKDGHKYGYLNLKDLDNLKMLGELINCQFEWLVN